MAGDISPIRDLGFLAWKNDLSWMESQIGPRWASAVAFENKQFADSLKPIQPLIRSFTRDLDLAHGKSEPWTHKKWSVKQSAFSPVQTWSYKNFRLEAWDADTAKSYLAAAVQDKGGYERFSLEIYKGTQRVQLVQNVGPQLAFLHSETNPYTVAYLGSDADHRYNSLRTIHSKTGEIKILYELPPDLTQNLDLRRLEDGTACIIKSDFITEELGIISGDTVNWVAKGASILPITKDIWIKDNKSSLGLPDEQIESISLKGEWAVTIANGIRTVWSIKDAKATSQIFVWGELTYDVRDPTTISISDIRYTPYNVNTQTYPWTLTPFKAQPFVCSYYNAKAPAFVVFDNDRGLQGVRGLLVTGYGAYGTPTKIGGLIKRWLPLLKSGWAIASVAVPGSGDNDLAWRRAGQRENRFKAIKTFIEAVRDLQEEFSVPSQRTALYGRSAGGLLVTAAVGQDPGLVGAIYVESPYVDVLRTISNPFYSLSKLETKEFGIGSNPTDMISSAAWSPMERIPEEGYPDLFVVARSDKADLEVYPYEILKYISRVRGKMNPKTKLLYISENKGHFTTSEKTRAEDLALLETWLSKKNVGDKYKMANKNRSRKNRNVTRKNKNRKNKASRKNRANKH